MTSQKKPSRDEIESKFLELQNSIIGTHDSITREHLIQENLHSLVENIYNSDYFENPHELTQRIRDHVDQLGSTAPPNVLPLQHFEQQLRSQTHWDKEKTDYSSGHWGKGTARGD